MIGYFFQKKREDAKRLLAGFMNRCFFQQVRYGPRRNARGQMSQVVWLIPCAAARSAPEFRRAIPVVTKDICNDGMALVLSQPLTAKTVVVGLEEPSQMRFLLCRVQHTSDLGYGFHQIGLLGEEVISPSPASRAELQRRMEEFAAQRLSQTPQLRPANAI